MVDSSANILFQLLRAALGSETEVSLPASVNWQEVIGLSFDQGVAAMLVDGIDKATKTKTTEALEALDSPELEDLKYEWLSPSGFSSLASPSSVATRDSSSKLDLSSRCSIGSHLGN